jgi:hypothetical protein
LVVRSSMASMASLGRLLVVEGALAGVKRTMSESVGDGEDGKMDCCEGAGLGFGSCAAAEGNPQTDATFLDGIAGCGASLAGLPQTDATALCEPELVLAMAERGGNPERGGKSFSDSPLCTSSGT